MCGISGFISNTIENYKEVLSTMVFHMNHRGPDSNGIYYNEKLSVGLAHARLSIVDLTETGHQPMFSPSKRFKMVFNGEIYNHFDIRKQLEKETNPQWRGTSDTETILMAFETWGIAKTVNTLIGMFAIALLDEEKEELHLLRDRFGEKPIYFGTVNGGFVFASDLKSISTFPKFNNSINRNALALFLKHSSIPAPYSIYEDIFKLNPGSHLKYNIKQKTYKEEEYWSTSKLVNEKSATRYQGSPSDAVARLENLLTTSVDLQMQADVPLGAFLSGGVDSSTVVALMQKLSSKKINTFSIGFEQKEYNEAEYAREVANHIGTNHHDAYMTNKDVIDIVPQIAKIYSEPFSESSLIPTFLVSKIAKEKVTVSLTGDAGDELFCGYSRYQLANNSWNKASKIPYPIRQGIASGISHTPLSVLELLSLPFGNKKDIKGKKINLPDKLLKMAPLLKFNKREELYHLGFMSHNMETLDWVKGSKTVETNFDNNIIKVDSFLEEMMGIDLITYLHNNNLTKVDRAAMATSLETRVPFLDHRVVDFALSLPIGYKIKDGVDKWVLREVLYKYVPKHLIERPKMGFAVPLAEWLRGPLKDLAESLLDKKRIDEEGFFDSNIVREKWSEHLSGRRNWENQLWDVIVFQLWLDEQKRK